MADQTPIHAYLRPRIAELVRGAVAQGMLQDAVVAVLIDIITSSEFDTDAPTPITDISPQ